LDHLADFEYLGAKILAPALVFARERQLISAQEEKILQIAAKVGIAKAADFEAAMPNMTATQRTYQIKKLVERQMLQPIKAGARQYTIGFSSSYLIRGVIRALNNEGFVPASLN
jgi:Fic family protein